MLGRNWKLHAKAFFFLKQTCTFVNPNIIIIMYFMYTMAMINNMINFQSL